MRRAAQDVALLFALAALLVLAPPGPLTFALTLAIPLVVGWGVLTLHFPARVEANEEGIAFFGYGRVHRFAWSAVQRIRVRRFIVRDRVLVRITPASPWSGRYWLVDSLHNYQDVVRLLEKRSGSQSKLKNPFSKENGVTNARI
jgi:hypothetical protein